MSATRDKGTVPPLAVCTGRFSIVESSERASGDSFTRIGICRSESENFAAFCSISPKVARSGAAMRELDVAISGRSAERRVRQSGLPGRAGTFLEWT